MLVPPFLRGKLDAPKFSFTVVTTLLLGIARPHPTTAAAAGMQTQYVKEILGVLRQRQSRSSNIAVRQYVRRRPQGWHSTRCCRSASGLRRHYGHASTDLEVHAGDAPTKHVQNT